ncbi:hypothetical protein CDAR_519021 [Caerostris darwini]|uniref:Uncharacterized protein n=1 Tax=Caerostris darwini TaxID=1538125 RepID=A0AAV4PPL4_9ARAC|nr:hypothetical protein CDAR_519021 [Caerostris darwini]
MAGTLNVVRFGGVSNASHVGNTSAPNCHPAQMTETVVLFSLAVIGIGTNSFLMLLILTKKSLRSLSCTWEEELLDMKSWWGTCHPTERGQQLLHFVEDGSSQMTFPSRIKRMDKE